MRVTTNEKFIARKARLGKYTSLAGLVVLTGGMIINFSKPELFEISLLCLIAGFGIASIGSYNVSRWVKPPRGDEVLTKSFKGLSNKYRLYNYILPVPHLLLTPFGLYVLHCKKQDGDVTYLGNNKWRQNIDFKRRFRLFFGGEQPLGNPSTELASEISTLTTVLKRLLPNDEVPVDGMIVFTHNDVNLTVEAQDGFPIARAGDIKKLLVEEQKTKSNWLNETLSKVAEVLDEQPVE